jgi:hypothetical protein
VRLATPRDEVLVSLRFRPALVEGPLFSMLSVMTDSRPSDVEREGTGESSCFVMVGCERASITVSVAGEGATSESSGAWLAMASRTR